MKEIKENVEVIEEVATEEVQTEETQKEGIFKRGVNFVKRNGKKIGAGALIGFGFFAAYALGKKSTDEGSEESDAVEPNNFDETGDSETDNTDF